MTRTALVTGAGGFIGRHLVRHLLERRYRVIAVDTDLEGIRTRIGDALLTPVESDIRDSAAMETAVDDVDVIFHLAAAHLEVGVGVDYYRDINVHAVERLLELAARRRVGRFVHCSSVGVYGALKTLPADEDTPCDPDIAYEVTKLEGELAVQQAVESQGLNCIILRPAWVYGPECPRTLKLLRAIIRRRFFFVGAGDNLRHPIYIRDMLTAFELAARASVPSGKTAIVAGPAAVTTRELVSKIMAVAGIRYHPPTLPLRPVTVACRALERAFGIFGAEPPFSSRSLKFFTQSSSFSIGRARRLLDFEPAVDLDTGLAETIMHARQVGLIPTMRDGRVDTKGS